MSTFLHGLHGWLRFTDMFCFETNNCLWDDPQSQTNVTQCFALAVLAQVAHSLENAALQ